MVKQTIQIFARVKPSKSSKVGLYDITEETDGSPLLNFTLPKELADGIINNKKESYKFRFEQVFDQSTKQDEIFESVARPVIDNVLEGYNGTIFAYGQTGSGKTFTITGGPERYSDRGIIPRTLSYIFDYQAKNTEFEFTTYVSYLEIYNENGYDLLDPKHEASKLEDLPKVSLMEDSDQNIHLKNLSTHQASTEEEALNLLFLGDTNRMIAETPMNQASTRSHCIFTIHVSSREAGSATIRRSKLHLVDLAGSERVSKTGVNGVLLTEAKYINLSLHYLEQVIVALSERSRQHIPYRNSMMTSVLRDSLGGNCMTTMIATCSVEKKNLAESISTCRFAQRVALIKNDAILNEELDPKLMIVRLKREIGQLKEELAMATGEQRTDSLSTEDIERCEEAVESYLSDRDPDATISVGSDMRKIHHCFHLLKKRVLQGGSGPQQARQSPQEQAPDDSSLPRAPAQSTEVSRLQQLISQRDNEINILVNMLKKEKQRAADALKRPLPPSSSTPSQPSNGHTEADRMSVTSSTPSRDSSAKQMLREKEERTKTKILGELSMGRQEAFEIFRRDYHSNHKIDESKRVLKQRYSQAKGLGEQVNSARTKINKLKSSIEQHRMSRVMQGLVNPDDPQPDEMEQEMRVQMEAEKSRYKEAFGQLRTLKTEIEHLQHLLERSKVQLMKDFELWWAEQVSQAQGEPEQPSDSKVKVKSAWRTPPITPSKASSSALSSHGSQTSLASSHTIDPPHPPPALSRGPHSGHSDPGLRARRTPVEGGIPLTGDAQADADIMAFMKARQHIASQAQIRR